MIGVEIIKKGSVKERIHKLNGITENNKFKKIRGTRVKITKKETFESKIIKKTVNTIAFLIALITSVIIFLIWGSSALTMYSLDKLISSEAIISITYIIMIIYLIVINISVGSRETLKMSSIMIIFSLILIFADILKSNMYQSSLDKIPMWTGITFLVYVFLTIGYKLFSVKSNKGIKELLTMMALSLIYILIIYTPNDNFTSKIYPIKILEIEQSEFFDETEKLFLSEGVHK